MCVGGRVIGLRFTVFAVMLASTTTTSADVVVEYHHKARPSDMDRLLAPMRDELAKAGALVEPADIVAAVGDALPLPGVTDPSLGSSYPAYLSGQVELGKKQVFSGQYETGLATLEGVRKGVHDNPGLIIVDPTAPTWLTTMYAAMTFARLRWPEQASPSERVNAATEVLDEQIRSFPELPIGRLVGPDVERLASKERSRLDALPHGEIVVSVSRPDAKIFLNEYGRGVGRATVDAPPGVYRILVLRFGVSRRYTLRVVPGRRTALDIDWSRDTAFIVSPGWIGFLSTEPLETVKQGPNSIARAQQQHDVLGLAVHDDSRGRYLLASVFDKGTGNESKNWYLRLGRSGGDEERCLRVLARLVLGRADQGGPCFDDSSAARSDGKAVAATPLLPSVLMGAGVASVLGGVAKVTSTKDPAVPQGYPASRYDVTGAVLLGAGGLAIIAGSYLNLRARDDSPRSRLPTYVAAGAAVSLFASGAYLIHLDGRADCGRPNPNDCPYDFDTGPTGWGLIGAGAAVTAFALYWEWSGPTASTVGVVPTAGGAVVTVTGRL